MTYVFVSYIRTFLLMYKNPHQHNSKNWFLGQYLIARQMTIIERKKQ